MAALALKPGGWPQHLGSALRERRLRTLYVVASAEPLLQIEAVDALRSAARELGYSEREVHTLAGRGFDWSSLAGGLDSQSLFAERRLIELRMPSGKPGRDGAAALPAIAARLAEAEAQRDDTLAVVVTLPLERDVTKASWFESLCDAGVSLRIDPVGRAALPRWIGERLAAQGQSAGAEALEFIAGRVEGNLLAAHQEIAKLGLLHGQRALTLAEVEDAVLDVARYNVFKLGDALRAGDPARFAQMLAGLEAEGEAMPLVLWALLDELRWLQKIRRLVDAGRATEQAIREANPWPRERQVDMAAAVERLDAAAIDQAVRRCAVVDKTSKGLASAAYGESMTGEPWTDLLATALALMPTAQRRPARARA